MNQAIVVLSAAALLNVGNVAWAQSSGGSFTVPNHTVDNGGGRSSGGVFVVTGSIGQPDASRSTHVGGAFQLTGGLFANGEGPPAGDVLFMNGFEG